MPGEPPGEETLYDQPRIDNSRARSSGSFTVEAAPAPNVESIDEMGSGGRSGEEKSRSLTPFAKGATGFGMTGGGGIPDTETKRGTAEARAEATTAADPSPPFVKSRRPGSG